MSHSFRPPIGAQPSVPAAQTTLPAGMVPPICTTGSPAVYPVMPNSYGLLTQQPPQYIAQPTVFPQPLTNVQSRVPFIPAVPANVPRMFVPIAAVPPGISPVTTDPAKLIEEQRRLEKERNFQLQQERLKQFTVAGKKANLNADNLIDSMFGKIQPKKNSATPTPVPPFKVNEFKETSEDENKAKNISFDSEKQRNEPSVTKTDPLFTFAKNTPVSASIKKDTKELHSMMLECSNLNAPSKALKFHKPAVKEITPSFRNNATFATSDKARDWRNIEGLDKAFIAPKPRFPTWCNKEKVPELYRKIQAIVTNNDLHPPETNLLFPILMSSGLSRELLGQIWELVNQSGSGQLSIEEMYAALALIAVAQAGHSVKNIDILHRLLSCPVPQLAFFTNAAVKPPDQNNTSLPVTTDENATSKTDTVQQLNQPTHHVVRPAAISIASHIEPSGDVKEIADVSQSAASWTPFAASSNASDDDFDDFKSATPTAVNFSLNTPSSQMPAVADDDFDDFKQAICIKSSDVNVSSSVKPLKSLEVAKESSTAATQDLMSPEEDKYSVFRSLQQVENTCQWGDFTFSSASNDSYAAFPIKNETENKDNSGNINYSCVLATKSFENEGLFTTNSLNMEANTQEDDEFGDFVDASVTSALPTTTVTDFADFTNFNQCEQIPTSEVDDEFGEFTSSAPVSLKPDMGHDFVFHQLKDNISLAESQSVSSLELGTFDGGGGHSGESKSSLSRQGSIPSLDLKSSALDGTDSEDCFAEIQLSAFVPRNSKSPSPVNNTKGSYESETSSIPIGQFFQPSTLPLTDKYSVIRQEKAKEEDQHISCWFRCLQSAVNILQNTKKIFNQMSCSSVCNEVLTSEEGGNYVKNVTEVYKVICRVGLVSKSLGKQTEAILDLLNEAEQVWNTICGFFAGSALMPEDSSLDFSSGILKPEPENNAKACGLCLLNIELRSKSFKQEECPKLSYGGRNYHSTCANFWVNCVDPLLPALVLPQLL